MVCLSERRGLLVAGWAACVIGCGEPIETAADTDAMPRDSAEVIDPACADLSWETAGAPFVFTWCTPCHSSTLADDQRAEAPRTVNFDNAQDVIDRADRVIARATVPGGTMPPAGGPDAESRALLAAWIACEVGVP